MLRYNQYAGATATTNGSGATAWPSIGSLTHALAAIDSSSPSWEQSFNAFTMQHGCDLENNGIMVVPAGFDMSVVPPKYRDKQVRRSTLLTTEMYFFRNPHAIQPY